MDTKRYAHPLDALIPDPVGKPPMCGEAEFAELLENMVAAHAPRVFVVVQEYGERVDGRIAAWGLSFDDHVSVVGLDGTTMRLNTPDLAVRSLAWGSHVRARLIWVKPEADG